MSTSGNDSELQTLLYSICLDGQAFFQSSKGRLRDNTLTVLYENLPDTTNWWHVRLVRAKTARLLRY